jgi:hypothetical protein
MTVSRRFFYASHRFCCFDYAAGREQVQYPFRYFVIVVVVVVVVALVVGSVADVSRFS